MLNLSPREQLFIYAVLAILAVVLTLHGINGNLTTVSQKLSVGKADTALSFASSTIYSQGKIDTTTTVIKPVSAVLTIAAAQVKCSSFVRQTSVAIPQRVTGTLSAPTPAGGTCPSAGGAFPATAAVDTSDFSSGMSDSLPDTVHCLIFSDTTASGVIARTQLCSKALPAETPGDLAGSTTITQPADTQINTHSVDTLKKTNDSLKTVNRTDTLRLTKIKKPLLSAPLAGAIGAVLVVVIEIALKIL